MKALAIFSGLIVAGTATADDRLLPIGNLCAGISSYMIERTEAAGAGWVRVWIAKLLGIGITQIPDAAPRLIWDVRCDDGHLAAVGGARNRAAADAVAETAPVGEGPWPAVRCAPDQTFPGVARTICTYHARRTEGKK